MSNINDKATVSLFVNGEQAEAAMDKLTQKAADLDKQLKEAMNAGDKKNADRLKREIDKVTKELNRTESAAKGTGIVLDNLSNSSIHGLRNALKYLEKELRMTKPNTEAWRAYSEQIKEVKARINELNGELEESKSLWQRFKEWSDSAWPAIDLLNQWGGSLFDVMRGAVDSYASMDQEMANVRKFTGMTATEVAGLNDEFKKMDTRTSRENLNKLAQEAGRLGKTSKEDVLGFVRAADQINVALDDLGEGATLTLSKLTGVFGDEQRYGTEQSLLKVGSVINELSQNCSASAPYLAQFASRMGGVGAQAKMTIPQIMAFGAVLDSNGQAVEASSTALSQVIVRMMQDPAKYAKVAGLDVKKFTDMLKTDVNSALILFLETLQKAGGMDTLSPMFADMGENGSRAIAALSTLATHIDDVKAQQREANKAFEEGTSVSKEFNVQNSTVQASIEKAKNAVNDLRVELGERLSPLMSHLISSSSAVVRALVTLVRFISENKMTIISLAAGIASYNAVVYWAIIRTKALAVASAAYNAVLGTLQLGIIAATGVTALLTGHVTKATAAFKLFSKAIKANPLGLAVSLITTAVAAIGGWISKVHNAREEERELARQREEQAREFCKQISDISKTAGSYAKSELDRLKKLYEATQDQTKSQKERLAAVQELQKTYPSAFGNLSQEEILAGKVAGAYNELAKNIRKAARAKAAAEKMQENEKQLLELDIEREDLENSIREDSELLEKALQKRKEIGKNSSNKNKFSLTGPSSKERRQLEAANVAVQNLNDNLDKSAERLEEIIMQSGELDKANKKLAKVASKTVPDIEFTETVTPNTGGGTGYVSQTKADKEQRKKEAEERRAAAKAKKEFKAELDSYKAQKSAADREVLELYKAGSIDYEELLRRRHVNELKYYDDSLAHFERTFSDQKESYLQDDKDYQKLLLDKEKSDESYEKNRVALALESINRRKTAEEQLAQHEYDVKSEKSVADEIKLQQDLYSIRRGALDEKLSLYAEGSKECADVQYEIEVLEQKRELDLKKSYFKAVEALREEYDKKSAADRFTQEKAALDALLESHILAAEQYSKYLEALTKKYKKELPGSDRRPRAVTWTDEDQEQYDNNNTELSKALAAGLITFEDYCNRIVNLDNEKREKMLAGLKEYGGEWDAMCADLYTSFSEMITSVGKEPEFFLDNLSKSVAAVSAAVAAGMQVATEFAKAESQIQINAVERRYDREIELAQGNSYKVAKLEKEREAKVNKIKSESAKKEFATKVLMGIAQTAQNALMAYTAGLSFPFPANTVMPPILAGIAVAQGMVQVALLKKQQQAAEAQGYSKGGFTKPGAVDEPAGIVHAGEWVASQKLLANPVARPMIEALDYAQRTNTIGSLRQDDVSRSIRANDSMARLAEDSGTAALMVAAMAQNSQAVGALVERLNEPFVTVNTVAGEFGSKQANDEYTRLMNNVTPKSKRSKK